jgi:hypothetical protein
MKQLLLVAALGCATSAFAAAPFGQASVTMPDGSKLVKNCNPKDEATPYRLDVMRRDYEMSSIEVGARPECPATIAIQQDKSTILHIVLGFTGHDRSQTMLDVGDTDNDLMQMKGMELQAGESRTAERNGVQYRVTRLR